MKSPFRRRRNRDHSEPATGSHDSGNHAAGDAAGREIVVEDVCKSFGDHVVLRDINVQIKTGELVVIVGESGCGKSVLLDIITGMIDPTSGRVFVADHDKPNSPLVNFSAMTEDQRAPIRRHWGEVFQRNALYGGTVYENIALWFTENTEMPKAEMDERIRRSIAAVNLDVENVINKPRRSLSGGMAKRVAIARAIAIEPVVMFYDEPTSGLDPVTATHIQDLIWRTHQEKSPLGIPRTTIVVSHDRELLRRLAPRVLMLHEAGVRFDGAFGDLEISNDVVIQRYLATMPKLHATSPATRNGGQPKQD